MRKLFLLLLPFTLLACAQQAEQNFELASQGLFDASISNDGTIALIASQRHGASLWNLNPLERVFNWNHESNEYTQITHTHLSKNGNFAITARNNEWILWDAKTGKAQNFWQTPSNINSIALSEDGSHALIGLASGDLWYTDTRSGNNVKEFQHADAIRSVALSGNTALSGSDDNSATFWDLNTGKALKTLDLSNASRHVAFSHSGAHAFVSSLREDHFVIDTTNFTIKSQINERYTVFNAAKFSNDDQRVYLANQQGYIQVFDTSSGEEVSRYQAKRKHVFGVSRSVEDLAILTNELLAITSDGQLQAFSISN
ncbi:hypothetical protein A3715_12375 [Oleiphilus sp. HI0009]|uniref:WD40 repeat domain-containing protein n=1 Tax=Oleiphilus sp. HI0125 TaxID=1822266 RepID=UPI0007C39C51|nr:PQQ-binding-like beta-propeller repeat protein [Oleiphilus sp. HI0125]KZX76826.1 hypothetical protein A3715_12375 [Oleiphilus sp. HI0009]KZZ58348.1 hypothetical protein A3762_00890 [Oleiphilus sp. HI0125]MCH2160011.1 PQQ-binding-like beta-propeller repeat protein [Oleiphilaceae bacterium]